MKDEIIRVLHYERFQGGEETPRNLHLLCISCEDEFSRHCLTALPPVGYQITVTNDQAQAISLLSETAVDLVIIGNTMKLKDRAALIFSVKHESPRDFRFVAACSWRACRPFRGFRGDLYRIYRIPVSNNPRSRGSIQVEASITRAKITTSMIHYLHSRVRHGYRDLSFLTIAGILSASAAPTAGP